MATAMVGDAAWALVITKRVKNRTRITEKATSESCTGRRIDTMNRLNLIPAIMFFLMISCAVAAAEEMEGYDENTELRLVGRVVSVSDAMRGPVIIVVKTTNRLYELYT